MKGNICVVGSINMDLVIQTARMPKPGETVTGRHFQVIPGGKGPIRRSRLRGRGAR